MYLQLVKSDVYNCKALECNNLTNDIIFTKYNVSEGDNIKLGENQCLCMIEKGKILDIKEEPGNYIIKKQKIKKVDKELEEFIIRKSEQEQLCIVFLNMNIINGNKYFINDPIKYIDWKDGKSFEIYIKLEGYYNFKIENPKKLFSKVIGLRRYLSKQELIEKVRKFILNSIENGINEISEEYKLDISTLALNSKKLEIKLKQNEHDVKLLEYGIKITYFDITRFEIAKKKFKFF